jgi:hypothetical protein
MENHGGGKFAKKHGVNRKIEKRHDGRVSEHARMIAQPKIADGHREADGYPKPGSRKKTY